MGLFLLIALIGLFSLGIDRNHLPAPRITSSISLNEKIAWAKKRPPETCDVIILGSSVALNNIDGNKISKKFHPTTNLAAWGLSVRDSASFMKIFLESCKPKQIVYLFSYGDFMSRPSIANWSEVHDFLKSKDLNLFYLKNLDIPYYINGYFDIKKSHTSTNLMYESLNFDESGSVLYEVDKFKINQKRWMGHDSLGVIKEALVLDNLQAFQDMANMAKVNDIKFYAVTATPRGDAKTSFKSIKALVDPAIYELKH